MKKIAYISGTRADFGLESLLLRTIEENPNFNLQLYVTGMHLMSEFGNTIDFVKEKFQNVQTIDVKFDTNDLSGVAVFAGKLLTEIVKELSQNCPDLMLVHGDRVEMLCAALGCIYLGIPIVHIHGGDKTTTVDDSARHAITKLSHIHFPATNEGAERIRLMGEEEWRIYTVGALSLDTILSEKLISRSELLKLLNMDKNSKFILVTQHPVSEEIDKAGAQMEKTLNAVKKFNLYTIVIYPNADLGSKEIIEVLKREKDNPLFRIFPNLDYKTFLSLEKEANVWVGNSSAGIVDSTTFKTPVVNVGCRQMGRPKGDNVIDVDYDGDEIYSAIEKSLFDKAYLDGLQNIVSPWGNGTAIPRIIKVLEELKIDKRLLMKK